MTRSLTTTLLALAAVAVWPAAASASPVSTATASAVAALPAFGGSEPPPAGGLLGETRLAAAAAAADAESPLGPALAQYGTRPATPYGGSRVPAGPTGDQTSPFGIEAQYTFLSRDVAEAFGGARFEFRVDSNRLLFKPTLRPAPFLEIYGLVGGGDLSGDEDLATFDGDLGLALGGGLKLTFFRNPEWSDTTLFVEGRYLQFESTANAVGFDTNGDGLPDVFLDEKFRWREWEGRFGVSWRFYLLRPYLGLRYSDSEADDIITGAGTRPTLRATDNIGAFIGATIYFDPSRRVGLNLEGSFPDYNSVTAGLRVWF